MPAKPQPEMMGATEVAEYLGVETSNLDAQARLPAAHQTLACGRIWRADQIRAFAEERANRRKKRG